MKNNIISATATDNAFVSCYFMTLAMKAEKMRQASDRIFYWPPAFWHHLSHLSHRHIFFIINKFVLFFSSSCFIALKTKLNFYLNASLPSCIWEIQEIIKDLQNIFIFNLDFIPSYLKDIMSKKPQKQNWNEEKFLIDILNSLVNSIMSRLRWMRGTLVMKTGIERKGSDQGSMAHTN